jgi:hypothetical protein
MKKNAYIIAGSWQTGQLDRYQIELSEKLVADREFF